MIDRILTVGGYTLLSRITGFVRDIMLAAILGAGPVADAFFVAFRLPNHFRAIFAEGAFNAAFIPAYARIRTQNGNGAAGIFGDRIFTLLIATQAVLLALEYHAIVRWEETLLETRLGQTYRDYAVRVPRWSKRIDQSPRQESGGHSNTLRGLRGRLEAGRGGIRF